MTDVLMPQMGESITEGTVTRWLKRIGDSVERDEPLLEISTDKVDAEIPSPATGVLAEIFIQEGATVAVATVLARIAAAEPAGVAPEPAPAPSAEPAPPTSAPVLPDAAAPVGPAHSAETAPPPSEEDLRRTRSSPLVRRMAAEHKVDIGAIRGTGLDGRVTKQDLEDYLAQAPPTAPKPSLTPAPPPPPPVVEARPLPAPAAPKAPPAAAPGTDQVVALSPIRRRTAEHMLASRRISAHATTVFEIDMTRVAQLRAAHRRAYEERGAALTYLPFILKATTEALKAYPLFNASLDGERILYHKDINLGVAVALDQGLIVPVIRNADRMGLFQLARAVADLAERARTRRLNVDEVQRGTFTVTNPGTFGSLFGMAILHQPQVAILAVGTIEKRPVVRDDAIAVRSMAYFALTFDHRLIDGADADRFMSHIKRGLTEFDESLL